MTHERSGAVASFGRRTKALLRVGAVCLFGGLTQPVAAQQPVPVGSEFQVNTYTTSYQIRPSVSVDADGDLARGARAEQRSEHVRLDGILANRLHARKVCSGGFPRTHRLSVKQCLAVVTREA